MATMIDGESYLGKVMVRSLSKTGDITMYLWPQRCLKNKMGGPTFGVDLNGEEIIRFDPHGPRGHWHKGGYDKLGAGGSHVEYPDDVRDIAGQIDWSINQIKEQGKQLLADAGHSAGSESWDPTMVEAATSAIKDHLKDEGDLRSKAIDQGLIDPNM